MISVRDKLLKLENLFFRALAQKYKTGILEYWDFLNTYVDLSSTEGLILLENHLAEKLREYEDEEARKIIDLERDLADLKIDSNDDSFFSSDQKKNQLNGVSSTLDFKTSYLVNQANGINVVSWIAFESYVLNLLMQAKTIT
jgi:hypothetical protein